MASSKDGIIHYGREGTLLIVACAASSWSDTAWGEFLDGTLALEAEMGGPSLLVLTYFPDGNPTARQRRASVEAAQKSRLADRVALLSDSTVIRGAFTAIQWVLGKQTEHKAFKSAEVPAAIDWLALGHPFDVAAARRQARTLVRAAHAAAGRPQPL